MIKLFHGYDPRDISHIYIRDPDTRQFRPVARRDGITTPTTLWEHEGDRVRRRAANARPNVEKVTLRRRITEIASRQKPSKADVRDAVRRAHAAEAPKPYEAMRPATQAPAEHPARQKRRLPVEDW